MSPNFCLSPIYGVRFTWKYCPFSLNASPFRVAIMAHGLLLVPSDAEPLKGAQHSAVVYPRSVHGSMRTTVVPALVPSLTSLGWVSCGAGVAKECYLVDPASSHMLVSKIKPCMCKYELIQTVKLRMAH